MHKVSAPCPEPVSPVNRRGLAYWLEKRQGRPMPSRSDIQPQEITDILPYVFLLDVRQDPVDFRYRLIGTKMDEHMTANYTGKWMSEIPHQQPGSRIWSNCEKVVKIKTPFSSDTPYVGKNKEFLRTEDLLMPLSDDGITVNMILVTVGFI